MTRDEIYKELYRYTAVLMKQILDETDLCLDDGMDQTDCSFYYDTMEHIKTTFLHILSFHQYFDTLFWEMALTPNSDPEAQAKAEEAIAWRLEKIRRRIRELEDGTDF